MQSDETRFRLFIHLFLIYLVVATATGLILRSTRFFERQDLQTINARFETRRFLNWHAESLKRLNLQTLWRYHETHEIPRRITAWDYTLSFLVENNHPPVINKILIFNRLPEDEPPKEALASYPWIEPLLDYPLKRKTIADMVRFLADSGARAIILDIEFPQYTDDDSDLARAIKYASDGGKFKTGDGKGKVPVLFASNPTRRTTGNLIQLRMAAPESGLTDELRRLFPAVDVGEKFSGSTGMLLDLDQVVRRAYLKLPTISGDEEDGLILKLMKELSLKVPRHLPDVIDIDYASPPNAELYPVRPLSYLIDPDRKKKIALGLSGSRDVTVKNAIVIIGDGMVDLHNTPVSSRGLDRMSGSEILAHTLETVSRGTPLWRADGFTWFAYMLISAGAGAGILLLSRKAESPDETTGVDPLRVIKNALCLTLTLSLSYSAASLLFSTKGLILPVVEPIAGLIVGFVAAAAFEREHERARHRQAELAHAKERLVIEEEKHKVELTLVKAESKAREAAQDRERRLEFARRINHDLRAPVSSLNWTIAALLARVENEELKGKIARLAQSSDKLTRLIDELVRSYDSRQEAEAAPDEICDLACLVRDSAQMQQALAEERSSLITVEAPEKAVTIRGKKTDVSRIIDNLIRNALIHNPEGTRVNAVVQIGEREGIVAISDDGKGISPQHLERIFDEGFRVEGTSAAGEGLGLNIVKTMTEKTGGVVQVESQQGQGTVFRLEWPLWSGSSNGANGDRSSGKHEIAPSDQEGTIA